MGMGVSQRQLFALCVIFLYSSLSAFLFPLVVQTSRYDSCLILMVSSLWGMLVVYWIFKLAERYNGVAFIDYGEQIMGKWLHKLMLGCVGLYMLLRAMLSLREITDYIVVNNLPETPNWAIAALIVLMAGLAAHAGAEVICRAAFTLFLLLAIVYLPLFPISFTIEFRMPMLLAFVNNHDIGGIMRGMWTAFPWYGDILFVWFFMDHFQPPALAKRAIFWALGVSAIIITSYGLLTLLAFGPEVSGELSYPISELVKSLSLADFIETLDPFLTILWIPMLMIRIAAMLYAAIVCMKGIVKANSYTLAAIGFSLAVCAGSFYVADNMITLQLFRLRVWPLISYTIQLIPLVYLLTDAARRVMRTSTPDGS